MGVSVHGNIFSPMSLPWLLLLPVRTRMRVSVCAWRWHIKIARDGKVRKHVRNSLSSFSFFSVDAHAFVDFTAVLLWRFSWMQIDAYIPNEIIRMHIRSVCSSDDYALRIHTVASVQRSYLLGILFVSFVFGQKDGDQRDLRKVRFLLCTTPARIVITMLGEA